MRAQYQTAAAARGVLLGPLSSRNYNPYGAEILKPDVATRVDVKNEVLMARAAGALQPAGEAPVPMEQSSRRIAALAAF